MRTIDIVIAIALASGPSQLPAFSFDHEKFDKREIIDTPAPAAFSVCFNHSCHTIETHSFNEEEWKRATSPLEVPAESAEKEREAIAHAIALMEDIIGKRTGTDKDLGKNLRGFGKTGQMDCIDESTNTTTYLAMLSEAGYLKWHTLMGRSTRFGLFAGMPHSTAVIRDNITSTRYSVDSWFFDNGIPPAVTELSVWKKGWDPGDTP